MDRTEIDLWLIISREFNEDPVIKPLLPITWLAARRRTMLILYKPKRIDTVENLQYLDTMLANILRKHGILRKHQTNGKGLSK